MGKCFQWFVYRFVSGPYRVGIGPYRVRIRPYIFLIFFQKIRAHQGAHRPDLWRPLDGSLPKKKQYRNHCSENKIIQKSLLMQILCPAKTFIFMRAPAECCIEKSARVFPPEKQCRNPFSQKKTIQKSLLMQIFIVPKKTFILMRAAPDGVLHGTRRLGP